MGAIEELNWNAHPSRIRAAGSHSLPSSFCLIQSGNRILAFSSSPSGEQPRSVSGESYLLLLPGRRILTLSVGSIVAAFLVNMFIWPYHARTRYFKVVAQTLDSLGELCE